MICNTCGYNDNGTGDSAHYCKSIRVNTLDSALAHLRIVFTKLTELEKRIAELEAMTPAKSVKARKATLKRLSHCIYYEFKRRNTTIKSINQHFLHRIYTSFLFILFCGFAQAGDFTTQLGISHFTAAPDGIWYQDAFPHNLKLNSASYGLRYDTQQYWKGESFSIGYMNLGRASVSSTVVAQDAPYDGGYSPILKACIGPCWPVSHLVGSGEVQGLYAAATQHFGNFSIDAGPYIYRATFSVTVFDNISCRTCPPTQVSMSHDPKIQVGLMLGVGYQYGAYSIRAAIWPTSTTGDPVGNPHDAVYDKRTYNVSVGYSF